MGYKFRDTPRLLASPVGRQHLRVGLISRLRIALMPVAALYRRAMLAQTRIVVVVGTYGKTSTAQVLKAILFPGFPLHSGFNSLSYVSLQLLRVRPTAEWAVFEAGINRAGTMAKFAWMIRPKVVVVTSIGSEHISSLGTLEKTRDEKAEMIRRLPVSGLAVLNGDDPNVMWMKDLTSARVVTFGFKKGNDVRACHIKHQWPPATQLHVEGFGQQGILNLRLLGRPMAYAVLGAVAMAMTEGFSLDEITPRIEKISPIKERLEPIALHQGAWIISDTFKGHIETVTSALDLASQIPATRRIVVLGLVDEQIGSTGNVYGTLGERVGKIADLAVFVGGKRQFASFRSHAARAGLPPEKVARATKAIPDAMAIFPFPLRSGDLIIVKGRGIQRLERITLALAGEDVQCSVKTCRITPGLRCHDCRMLTRAHP